MLKKISVECPSKRNTANEVSLKRCFYTVVFVVVVFIDLVKLQTGNFSHSASLYTFFVMSILTRVSD